MEKQRKKNTGSNFQMAPEVQHLNLAPVHRLLDLSAGPASSTCTLLPP